MSDYHPYIRIMTDIIDSGVWAELSSAAKTLYPVLLKFSDFHFKPVWPSTETLLRLTGFKTKKSIVLAKKDLVRAGLLFQVPGGGRTSTRYHFSFHYPGSKITPLGEKHRPLREEYPSSSAGEKTTEERGVPGSPNHINITISNQNHLEKENAMVGKKRDKEKAEENGIQDLIALFGSEIVFSAYREAESLHLEKDLEYLKAACRKAVLLKTKQMPPERIAPPLATASWKAFLDWGSTNLSHSTWKELQSAEVEWDGRTLVVQSPMSGFGKQIVLQYFQKKIEPPLLVLFADPEDASRLMEIR